MRSEKMNKYRYLSRILPQENKRKLVIITGARQTGKTTLVKNRYPNLYYINLDAPENRDFIREISSFAWAQELGNAVIDEAQKEPVVFEKIKYAYDEKKISFGVLLGSSQILLLKKIRESLAGRVSIYELWPLLFSEISQESSKSLSDFPLVNSLFSELSLPEIFKNIPTRLLPKQEEKLKKNEKEFMLWGGMPALLQLNSEEKRKWLKDYEYTYLTRDLSDLARLDNLQPFRKFQKIAALRSANLLSYSEIARDTGISVDTARRYLQYLNISYQTILLQPFTKNITSSAIKTPKIYWLDIGLLRQLTGYWGEVNGQIFETLVIAEMIKWHKTMQVNGELFFYRTHSGLEIDLILKTDYGIRGIEIKSRERVVPKDIKALKKLAAKLGKQWQGGLVIYRGNEIKKIDEPDIWMIPFKRLFT